MAAQALTFSMTTDAGSALFTFALPLHKLDAISAPGVGDDDLDGYVAGSEWVDRTNDKIYKCTDNGTGAAVWVQIAGAGMGSGTVTSVAIAVPTGLGVSGSPITTSGTITLSLANDLAALEGLSSTGFAVRTTTDTWAQRTITGTSNRVTVTNGDGVSGNPTLDIAATYVGQASITTLGTIATGTWAGTTITVDHGGTGRASHTAYAVLCGGTTTTGAQQSVVSVGTAGQLLTSNGAGALPSFQDPPSLSITGLTATDPAFADEVPLYDVSATANRKATVQRLLGLVKAEPGGRLTLTTGLPITLTGVTGSTVYYTPFVNNWLTLWDGTRWLPHYFDEFAIAAPSGSAGDNFDVFAFASTATPSSTNTGTDIITFSGATGWATGSMVTVSATAGGLTAGTTYWWNAASSTTGSLHASLANALAGSSKVDLTASITAELTAISLETLIWTNNTTRATAVTYQDGILCKSGDKTRLYLGSISLTSSAVIDDTDAVRNLWNQYNRAVRKLKKAETTASWTYATASWRALNNASTNAVAALLGDPACRTFISLTVLAGVESGSALRAGYVGIGQNSATQNDADATSPGAVAGNVPASSVLIAIPTSVGRTTWYATEYAGGGTSTFYGATAQIKTALTGWYLG